jgi:hypothetical protein
VHIQRVVSLVIVATVLDECTTEDQRYVLRFFCGQKDSMQKIFIKKCVLFTAGKCLSRKAVHNWVEKFSQGRSKVADDETEVRKWLRQQSKRLLRCGFRRTGKAMG